jgi:hydroxymethylglutaryl-CoA lyase
MSDMPARVTIEEEGPREGFQIETGPIPTARKIELIDALSTTGLKHIQIVSFVDPKRVPGMADAEAVVAGYRRHPGIDYTALWLNERGLERALATGRLDLGGRLHLSASEPFLRRNQNRSFEDDVRQQRLYMDSYRRHGLKLRRVILMAVFGCNFAGDIPIERVLNAIARLREIAADYGETIEWLSLADTMAWATPLSIKRVVGAVRERWPDQRLSLHLHDTRGMAIANAYAGLEMGVDRYDAAVAGLGGCPFAGHAGAAGNVSTEDLVFLCEEMGIATGIDLDRLIEVARLAEDIVGHPLPGSVMKGGSLKPLREAVLRAKVA